MTSVVAPERMSETNCLKTQCTQLLLLDFSLTVKAAPHECVIRTGQP